MISVFEEGTPVPFYKPFKGEMNAVFGCTCFVEEQENKFIVSSIDTDKPFVLSDIVYAAKKPIHFIRTTEAEMKVNN
jgi:hypothetical protein